MSPKENIEKIREAMDDLLRTSFDQFTAADLRELQNVSVLLTGTNMSIRKAVLDLFNNYATDEQKKKFYGIL